MAEYRVGAESEIVEGDRKVVQCGEAEIGIFRFQGALHAWHNRCPHREGPVCQGRMIHRVIEPVAAGGTVRTLAYDEDHLHIVCPWHGYEFDVADGRSVSSAQYRLRPAKLRVEDGELYVEL